MTDLDRQVAEQLIYPTKTTLIVPGHDGPVQMAPGGEHMMPWSPSTNLLAAFQMVERMKDLNCGIVMARALSEWKVGFATQRRYAPYEAKDNSLPRAICLAALKAVDETK